MNAASPFPCCRAAAALALSAATLAGSAAARAQSSTQDPFRGSRDMGSEMPAPRPMDALPLYFPPSPPPLGRAIARPPVTVTPDRNAAPPELAGCVSEIFYPPLGTRLALKSLSARQREQLERHRAEKRALQEELRAELERLHGAEPATREAGLAALARRQAARLAALEKSAEDLRRDLITSDNHWSALRQWRLGDKDRRGYSPLEIAQVMRGYAYYRNGLLPAQRRLLREIFLELANAGDTPEKAAAAQPYMFFPPEPARVLLPDDLPPDVAAQIAAYQTRKSKLKKELYDAVCAEDGKSFAFLRNDGLKSLGEKQASALAELETLAEEIRRGLARTAEPSTIGERSPLPPVLQNRVSALLHALTAAQKEASAQLDAILAEAKGAPLQGNYRFENDGLKFVVIPTRTRHGSVSPETAALVSALRAKMADVANDYGRRVAELVNEKDAIRAEVVQTFGSPKAATIDAALTAATRVAVAQETEELYRDYRIAVFQPGLSPEQRRLLFDHVVERLDLPLPPAEPQPIFRASRW